MNRMVVFGVSGLLFGALAGTGASWVKRAPPEPVHAAADSTAVPASVDSTHAPRVAQGTDVAAPHGADSAAASPLQPPPPAVPQVGAAPAAVAQATTDDSTDVARLSQIFGTMKPQEAARVLEKLEDAQVERLLLELTDRKAAAIMASLPPERAAMVTRGMLNRKRP